MSSLWSRLRRNGKETGKRKKRKANPYASSGRETFALVVTERQAKRLAASVDDKTAMSVSAAVRSLSKSAEDRNSSTLSRTASTKGITSGELSNAQAEAAAKPGRESGSQQQDLNCATELSTSIDHAEDKNEGGEEVMDIDVAKGRRGGNPRQELDRAQEEAATGSCVHREAEGRIFEPRVYRNRAEIAELPLKMTAPSKKRRGSLACVRGKAASNAAGAVLLAVGTFFASKRAEFGKGIAAAMTFSIVIRRWRNGKLYARFIFSAMASYFLGHLHSSYLFSLSPKRLTISSPGLRKVQDDPKKIESATTTIEQEQQILSFAFPTLPSGSSSPPSPKSVPATEIKSPSTHPVSPKTSQANDASLSTSLGRKLSWRLKSRLMKSFQLSRLGAAPDGNNSVNSTAISTTTSSGDDNRVAPGSDLPLSRTSKMENSDSDSASSAASPQHDAAASRPERGKRFPFSRKPIANSEFPKVAETGQGGGGGGARGNHRHRSSKRSSGSNRLSRDASTKEVQRFTTMAYASSSSGLRNIKTSVLPTVAEGREMFKMYSSSSASSSLESWGLGEMWPLCALLIALLFLLAGQVLAILATSTFLLVLSQILKSRSSRGQGQDQKDVTRRALEEASRKLQLPSIPGSPVQSLPRASDILSMEYHKRISIQGLLERNRKGGC